MTKNLMDLMENVDLTESLGGADIDEVNGVLKNVVLMTGNKKSENNTLYSSKAVQEGLSRYEGAKMYLDHPRTDELAQRRGNRSVRDLAGVYRGLRIEEGAQPKLRGDLHVMESMKSLVISIAKNPPKGTGLSLRDRGRYRTEKGLTLVEGFEEGADFSVDLVTRASLNKSLFESTQEGGGEETMDITKLTLEQLEEGRKDLVDALTQKAIAGFTKQLEEAKVKLVGADKLQALTEAAMPKEFKEAIRPVIMKAEVTLEEAKSIISSQETLAKAFSAKVETKKAGDPKVNAGASRPVEEGTESVDDAAIIAAFK
jgi:hypothetical protein